VVNGRLSAVGVAEGAYVGAAVGCGVGVSVGLLVEAVGETVGIAEGHQVVASPQRQFPQVPSEMAQNDNVASQISQPFKQHRPSNMKSSRPPSRATACAMHRE